MTVEMIVWQTATHLPIQAPVAATRALSERSTFHVSDSPGLAAAQCQVVQRCDFDRGSSLGLKSLTAVRKTQPEHLGSVYEQPECVLVVSQCLSFVI